VVTDVFEMLNTIGHELLSPLASLMGYTETLLRVEDRLSPAERQEFLHAIFSAGARLDTILRNLLELARLQQDESVNRHEVVDMRLLVQQAVQAAMERGEHLGRTFTWTFTESPATSETWEGPVDIAQKSHMESPRDGAESPTAAPSHASGGGAAPMIDEQTDNALHADEPLLLIGDPQRLRLVVDHVLGNAMTYSPHGGPIEVVLQIVQAPNTSGASDGQTSEGVWAERSERPTAMYLRVHDHGIGIPAEQLERIFEPFHRVETGLTRTVYGLGVGLALCRRIVTAHGGAIWAESAPANGATFHIVLPLLSKPVTTGTNSTEAQTEQ